MTGATRRWNPWAALAALALVGAGAAALLLARPEAPPVLRDDFSVGTLDPGRWVVTRDGELSEAVADVIAPDAERGRRLRLRVGTRGTRDDEVKRLGVRTAAPVVLAGGAGGVGVELDWNGQQNGSYLAADVVLSPHRTDGNALATPDFIRAGYVGVPPGRNARLVVSQRVRGRERTLFTDGWPDANRAGRPIARQKLELRVRGTTLEVVENGRALLRTEVPSPGLDGAFLYLQVSTHSNYPARDVFFDDVAVTRG